MTSASAAKAKAIADGLDRLAAAYNESLTPIRLEVYAMALADLTPDELSAGFNRAIRELKFWPRPAELRELATGRAAATADNLLTDKAWMWVHDCITMFRLPAQNRYEVQGRVRHGMNLNAALRGKQGDSVLDLATSAPFYEVTVWPEPEIPDLVKQTLIAMGGSEKMGLTRIQDAMRGWDSGGEASLGSKDAAFVRKDFDEHCSRAIAACRQPMAATINPARQLTGEVAPALPPLAVRRVAVRLERGDFEYKAARLTLAEATALHEAGTLPQHLYDDAVHYWRRVAEEQERLSTPVEYNAVCLGLYEPAYEVGAPAGASHDEQVKAMLDEAARLRPGWVPIACFRIERGDGSAVVYPNLVMAIGDMKLNKGQVVRFLAKPRDLYFSDRPFHCFDINAAQITAKKEK
ncbi:MAG: hypothetical protein ABSG54_18520 [Terriglobia bacterium]